MTSSSQGHKVGTDVMHQGQVATSHSMLTSSLKRHKVSTDVTSETSCIKDRWNCNKPQHDDILITRTQS
eukprot:1093939-Pelagomonas_calceolata.AAC.2